MRVLLTGASGLIGSGLKVSLNKSGHEVVEISRKAINQGSWMYTGSITDEIFLKNLVKDVNNVDAVIHLAAEKETSVKSRTFETNVYGTELMLKTANELGSNQFILISGTSVLNGGGLKVITEDSAPRPIGTYLLTKYLSEQVLIHNRDFLGQKKIVRIPSPVGPTLNKDKIFKKFIECALLDLDLEIWGNGKREQNYLDLRDFNEALELLMDYSEQGVWNIAGPKEISDKDLADKIIETTKSNSKIKILNKKGLSEMSMPKISTLKIQKDLGFDFQRSIEDTILWVAQGVRI